MKILLNFSKDSVNDNNWFIFLNEDSKENLLYGWVDQFKHPTKPTRRQLRKLKRNFRKEIKEEMKRQKSEREYEDIVIDVLGM